MYSSEPLDVLFLNILVSNSSAFLGFCERTKRFVPSQSKLGGVCYIPDELALVTAINTMRRVATAPPEPKRATAAYGRTRPAETSASGIRLGYVGNAGLPSSAIAESPIVVAVSQGMANQDRPPKM